MTLSSIKALPSFKGKTESNSLKCLLSDLFKPFITTRVGFQTHNTTVFTEAIIDCGATTNFILNSFITGLNLTHSDKLSSAVRDMNNTVITPTSSNLVFYIDILINGETSYT